VITESILAFNQVRKVYHRKNAEVTALKDLSFSLPPDSSTLVTGPSGSGKTSLIYLAGLIKTPSSGKICIKGVPTSDLDDSERSLMIRNEIGFIFRRANLLPYLNILENVMLPMSSPDEGKAGKLLEKAHVDNWDRFPRDMSPEEVQKVTLARSLVNDPAIVLADEPTAELDREATANFLELLGKIDATLLLTSSQSSLHNFFDKSYMLEYGVLRSYP
jgi:ABC-type lipoprotein export system ATPase subunit